MIQTSRIVIPTKPHLPIEEYRVGWICALVEELAASQTMLDEIHEGHFDQDILDTNTYVLGQIQQHNVVIACLPSGRYGKASAAVVATHMARTFKNLRFGLLVGIGGGLPGTDAVEFARLGDVVVSQPEGISGGVLQYDLIKKEQGGTFIRKGALNSPPQTLLTALANLQAKHELMDSQMPEFIKKAHKCWPKITKKGYSFPGAEKDCLFEPSCSHVKDAKDCVGCGKTRLIARNRGDDKDPHLFYGTILSADQLIKDSIDRQALMELYKSEKPVCVEMEAAGLMNAFPCLVIRGICDYADSHKNDKWHNYAALAAAAFAKELLDYVSPAKTLSERPIHDVLGTITEDVEVIRQRLEERDYQRQEEQLQKCHTALNVCNYENFKDINPKPVPGTCQWVLTNDKYLDWAKKSRNDLLWISADPGCGKSVLAKMLVDNVLQLDLRSVCYFFFKDNSEQDSISTAICAILHQLFTHQPQLRHHAQESFNKYGSQMVQNHQVLWRILMAAIEDREAQPLFCVFDALDEANDESRRVLIERLCAFYQEAYIKTEGVAKLKIVVTSRPYDNIQHEFQPINAALPEIRLRGEDENKLIREEIDLVIKHRIKYLAKELEMSDDTKRRLEEKLISMQHRTYLWLHLSMEDIRLVYKHSMDHNLLWIDTLPSSVQAAYENILNRVHPNIRDRVRQILGIIVGARRPLRVDELRVALTVLVGGWLALDDMTISDEQLEQRIREWCGLFVFFNHQKVYLIHQTAKEFLLCTTPSQTELGLWAHSLMMSDVEGAMAYICVEYLSFPAFNTPSSQYMRHFRQSRSSPTTEPLGIMPDRDTGPQPNPVTMLFDYAARYWIEHVKCADKYSRSYLSDRVRSLHDTTSYVFSKWFPLAWEQLYARRVPPKIYTVHLAMITNSFGLLDAEYLLSDGDYERLDSQGRTPLLFAADFGLTSGAWWLLQRGANVCTCFEPNNMYSSGRRFLPPGTSFDALATAAARGYDIIVDMILLTYAQHLRDATGRGEHSRAQSHWILVSKAFALHTACLADRKSIVALLLSAGADPNGFVGKYGTTLEVSTWRNQAEIFQMLVDHGADVHSHALNYPLLHNVVYHGGLEQLRILFQAGAGATLDERAWYTSRRLRRSREPRVKFFDSGQERESLAYMFNGPALHMVAQTGTIEMAVALIKAGADVNLEGPLGNAAETARYYGQTELAAMIAREGAELKTCDELGKKADEEYGDKDVGEILRRPRWLSEPPYVTSKKRSTYPRC